MILNGFQRSFRFLRTEFYHQNQAIFFLGSLSDCFCDSFYKAHLHAQAVLGSGAKEPFTVVGSSIRASEAQRLGVMDLSSRTQLLTYWHTGALTAWLLDMYWIVFGWEWVAMDCIVFVTEGSTATAMAKDQQTTLVCMWVFLPTRSKSIQYHNIYPIFLNRCESDLIPSPHSKFGKLKFQTEKSRCKMLRLEAAVREISYFLEADGSGHAPAKCPGEPRNVEVSWGFRMFSTMFNRPSLSLTHCTRNRYCLREAQRLGRRSSFRTCRFHFLFWIGILIGQA